MRVFYTTYISFFVIVSSAVARIGENADELVARFGKPTTEASQIASMPGIEAKEFHFKNWQIGAHLLKGRCVFETYRKDAVQDAQGIMRGGAFSDGDIEIILGANSMGKTWMPVSSISYFGKLRSVGSFESPYTLAKIWVTEDRSLICIDEHFVQVDRSYFNLLTIFSQEYNECRASLATKKRDQEIKKSGL